MKKIGSYTARGIVTESETEAGLPQKIPLFDGKFTTGYRVINFKIWASTWNSSTQPDAIGKLSKNNLGTTGASNFMRADDDNQIAWATTNGGSDTGGTFAESIIDKDNLIVEDLYVYVRTAGTNAINYLIEMEKYSISDWQGALSMSRDKAQE